MIYFILALVGFLYSAYRMRKLYKDQEVLQKSFKEDFPKTEFSLELIALLELLAFIWVFGEYVNADAGALVKGFTACVLGAWISVVVIKAKFIGAKDPTAKGVFFQERLQHVTGEFERTIKNMQAAADFKNFDNAHILAHHLAALHPVVAHVKNSDIHEVGFVRFMQETEKLIDVFFDYAKNLQKPNPFWTNFQDPTVFEALIRTATEGRQLSIARNYTGNHHFYTLVLLPAEQVAASSSSGELDLMHTNLLIMLAHFASYAKISTEQGHRSSLTTMGQRIVNPD